MAERIMLLLVTVLLAPDLSSAISSQFYPNLQDNPSACWNRTEPMPYNLRICDPEKVVSPQQGEQHPSPYFRRLAWVPQSNVLFLREEVLMPEGMGWNSTILNEMG